jgi:hypothetical protein
MSRPRKREIDHDVEKQCGRRPSVGQVRHFWNRQIRRVRFKEQTGLRIPARLAQERAIRSQGGCLDNPLQMADRRPFTPCRDRRDAPVGWMGRLDLASFALHELNDARQQFAQVGQGERRDPR